MQLVSCFFFQFFHVFCMKKNVTKNYNNHQKQRFYDITNTLTNLRA